MNKNQTNKKETAFNIVNKLKNNGFETYLVGGCVRDAHMDIEPKDWDIATKATAEQVMRLFKKTIPVGVQFGVVRVIENNFDFEVATFRQDGKYIDGRRPEDVIFSSAKEDVKRRDFTINGLLFDPDTNQTIDFCNGQKDIENKIIRTIGVAHERFTEDKLRMLRAIRFAVRLNFLIEEKTFNAISDLADKITEVSPERINEELTKILILPARAKGIKLMKKCGLLKHLLPSVAALDGVEQPPQFHPEGDCFKHTVLCLESLIEPVSPELAWSALLHDIGKPPTMTITDRIRFNGHCEVGAKMADKILRDLHFSNDSRKKIVKSIKDHMKFKDVQNMRVNKLKRFIREDNFAEELNLHQADCMASHQMLDNYYFCKQKIEEFGPELIKQPNLISGADLISLGYKPGPLFKQMLTEIEDMMLENTITTKEEALAYIKKNFSINK